MQAVRMNWLDIAKLSAAFGIIGIHTTTDSKGEAFVDYGLSERAFPVLMRATSELASSEFFILVSLFLLAFKLETQPMSYGTTMKLQMRRLLIPFTFWTFFYAFFVLIKAQYFGYLEPMLEQLASPSTWIGYFLLGSSQYHLHYIPELFLTFLFYPLFKPALKVPLLGLLIVPLLSFHLSISTWIWGNISDKTTLEYMARGAKILSYTGYGFAAYSILGLWQRRFDEAFSKKVFWFGVIAVSILFVIKLEHAVLSIDAGSYIPKVGSIYYAYGLIPVALMLMFLGSQHFKWPEDMGHWSKFAFGIYLMHPAVIDGLDIFLSGTQIAPYQLVIFKYSVTLLTAILLSIVVSKIRWLAWTIALGPLPFARKNQQVLIKV